MIKTNVIVAIATTVCLCCLLSTQAMAASIRDNCKKKWGDDYAMVQYCIEKQEKARRWLRAHSGDPGIKSRCEAKWGDDYVMVQYCIEKQEKAKRSLGY